MRLVLVHGGLHGAWCWEKLTPHLVALGHEVVTVELPGHGTRRDETASIEAYTDTVVDVLEPGDVVIGHSLGGIVITAVADRVGDQIGRLIYIAGYVPEDGKSATDTASFGDLDLAAYLENFDVRYAEDGSSWWIGSLEGATNLFYHDCPPELAQWAYERLTPQQVAPSVEPIALKNFGSLSVPRTFIRCAEDRSLALDVAEGFADRLGVDPVVFPSSHSPFLSRPKEFAVVIDAQL